MFIYFLLQFFEGFAIYLITLTLAGLKNKISLFKLIILSLFHGIVYFIITQLFPVHLHGVILIIITVIFSSLLLNIDFILSSFCSLASQLIKIILEVVTIIFCFSILKIPLNDFKEYTTIRILLTLIVQTIYLFIALLIYRKNVNIPNKYCLNNKTHLLISSLFSILSIFITFLIIINSYLSSYQTLLYVFFVITFISLLFTMYKLNKYIVSMAVKEMQLEDQNIYIEYIKELMNHLKGQRHEFINHINVLYGLVQIKDITRLETAKNYIENLNITIQGTSNIMSTDEPVVSGLLFTKTAIAEEKNIEFDVHISDKITNTHLSLTEISIVLNNLINNAIEFLDSISEEKRYLYFEIIGDKKNIYIDIVNENNGHPIPNKNLIFNKGFSTKLNDREFRGFGLFNVKNIVEKHHGSIKVESDLHETSFKVTLPKK